MSRSLKIIVITVAVIFALLLSSMVIVPWQVKKQGSHWIAENTDRSLTIEKVYFNPFTLTVEISGTKLTEQNTDQSFVAFKRLMFSISPKSIIKQAVILSRIELDDLFVNIEILGEDEFNFSDFTQLGNKNPESDTSEETEPLYFSLNNIILTNGSINFTDQTSVDKTQHQIRQLLLNIPVIGNIPYLVENYVEPKLSMLLNDAEVKVTGELKPFKDSRETKLFLNFTGVDLAYYAHHSPITLPEGWIVFGLGFGDTDATTISDPVTLAEIDVFTEFCNESGVLFSIVPEPGVLVTAATGLIALCGIVRRKFRA